MHPACPRPHCQPALHCLPRLALPPAQVYTTYARSHLYFAMELVVMMVLLALVSTTVRTLGDTPC
jgi:hypothetical protein